jgi:hypothetical protein
MSECGKIQRYYTAKGLRRYSIEISHPQLNKYQEIKGEDRYVVEKKAHAKMRDWDDMWERRLRASNKMTKY